LEHGDVGPQTAVKRGPHFLYLILALGSAAYLFLFLRVLWRVGDEGTLVYGAQRVAQGAVPYRDFFEVMGPGTFYWLGLFFRIFGTTWLVARVSLLITGVGTTLAVFWLARRLSLASALLPTIIVLALTIPLWPATNHHWDSNLFALLSFAAFVSWLETPNRWKLITAAVLAGATTLFLQQKGALLFLSLLLIVFLVRRKQPGFLSSVAHLAAGYVAVLFLTVSYFFASGAFPQFLYANFIWPSTNYHNVNLVSYAYGLRSLYWKSWFDLLIAVVSPAAAYSISGVLLLPFLVVAGLPLLLVVLGLSRRAEAFGPTTLPYWLAGSALWISEIHRADITHLIYGAPILLIVCLYLWQLQPNRFWGYAKNALALSVGLFVIFNALIAQGAQTRMVTRRGTVYAFVKDDALEFLDHQTQPGEDVFVYPYYPMYYFLSGTTNPTRFSILMYHINTEAQFRETVSALEQKKVRYVLWDTLVDGPNLKQWFPGYQQPSPDKLLVEPYLKQHYELIGYKNGFRLLQRKDLTATAVSQASPNKSPGS
jgi:hypothetical protein